MNKGATPQPEAGRSPDRAAGQKWSLGLILWLGGAIVCFIVAWFLVLAHPDEAVDEKDIPVETAIAGETRIPADRPKMLRTPPTYSYYQRAAPYFKLKHNPPVIEVQLDTTSDTGTVRLSLTSLVKGDCELHFAPYAARRIGASVNYVGDDSQQEVMDIHFEQLGDENRIDDNSMRAIHRRWWVTELKLDRPSERYLVVCPVNAEPDWESAVDRHILFEGPRSDAMTFKRPLADNNYAVPGADETTGLVRFFLTDAQDAAYEGAVAETPNSDAAHRFRISYTHGAVNAHWTDTVASRRHDLWLFLGGVLAALGTTILFELLKLWFPFEGRKP